ncbi:hypothetical protein MTR_1g007620 [Medicago truncatula]|uniref:Uncharacterized protein n=1 Tax=Medicago truncatula TaxID=3880 RepID=G7I3E1_MEDTR|nr:hypothetical protein MTR_1g007620 [Medicago truncatula]
MKGRKSIRSLSADILSLSGKCKRRKEREKNIEREASTLALTASPMVHRWRFITLFWCTLLCQIRFKSITNFFFQRFNPFGVHNGKKA